MHRDVHCVTRAVPVDLSTEEGICTPDASETTGTARSQGLRRLPPSTTPAAAAGTAGWLNKDVTPRLTDTTQGSYTC